MKKCTKCGEEKPLEKFTKDNRNKDGRGGQCKVCRNLVQKANHCPEAYRRKSQKWYEENPQKHLDKCAREKNKRRARLANVPSDNWTRSEVFTGNCWYCGIEVSIQNFHADHFVPLAKGGSNTRDNIVCSCANCNLRKSDKLPYDFIRENINDA